MDRPTNLSIDYLDLLPDEILLEILIKTDDLKTLSKWCQTSKRINNICQDKVLWKQKYEKDFGNTILSEGKTWKEQYKRTVRFSSNSPIYAGRYSYGIIDQNGNLYISGNVELLGIEKQFQPNSYFRKLHLIKFPQTVQGNNFISPKVVSISISANLYPVATAVTENGKAYIWGDPESASSGFQKDTKITYLPREIILPLRSNGVLHESIALPTKAIKIRVSGLGYIILLEDSTVWLNIGIKLDKNHKIDFNGLLKTKAIDISIESEIYAIISKDNRVFVGGKIYGTRKHVLFNIKFPKLAKRIIIDSKYFMVLSTTGEVYTLHISNILSGNTFFKLVKLPEPIVQISYKSETFAALSETGKLYMWGHNYGNLISGGSKNIYSNPVEISFGKPINFVTVGERLTIAVSNDGMVNYWGDSRMKLE